MMKKWMIITVIAFIFVIGVVVSIYLNATEPVKAAEANARHKAQRETNLTGFTDFHLYHGEETYYVFKAKNQKKQTVFVWVPEKEGAVITRKQKDALTRNQAIEKLYEARNPEKIVEVRPGIIKDRPVWEIYYRSKNNSINYYYMDFETGEKLRVIDNL
ncbi:cell wall elongation regulator TseB-like domain-containing protein [Bacillus sp. T33-2]|uniref:cell wall elongation regulator TseB-like domain-containing protein n=1 Tax=Bacillus sp. T33-2 TaxID=2054168 RepID=UPI000C773302|nr:DUF5590 domain-containing protein [Bacillus sp. T33-2]PLR99716.1 peptidase [Bacillus sp. T33-2]